MWKTYLHNLRFFPRFPIGSLWLPNPSVIFFRPPERRRSFHWSLTTVRKSNYDELKRIFWQNYTPNADVLNAQIKFFLQLTHQDVSVFYRSLCDLDPIAYTDDAVCNEHLLVTFIEGLANFIVRCEERNVKPTVIDNPVSLTLEKQSYLNLYGQQPDTPAASVNNSTRPSLSQSELLCDLIFTVEAEVKRPVDEAALVNVLPAAGRNLRGPTTTRIKANAAIRTKTKKNWTNRQGNTP